MSNHEMPNPDRRTREILQLVIQLLDGKYASSVRSVYLHCSRRGVASAPPPGSDIDITVILRDASWQTHVGNDLRNLALNLPVALDATIHTVAALNRPVNGYDAGRVLYAGDLVTGVDIRNELSIDAVATGHRRRVIEQARKGIALLRGVGTVPKALHYPDATLPFYGYEIVRKPSWYDDGILEGTKELVATATWCASAWLAVYAHRQTYSKQEAVTNYRETRSGDDGALVAAIWSLCRERLGYQLPALKEDRAELRHLCSGFLALETEVIALTSGE